MPTAARYHVPVTRLSRRSLFALVADEAYRDGLLDAREVRLLRDAAAAFELTEAEAAAGRRRAFLRYRAGKLGHKRAMDPRYLLEKVYAAMGPGGAADPVEAARVEELRDMLGVPREDLPALREAAEVHRLRWTRMVAEVGLAAEALEPHAPVQLEHHAPGGASCA